jgi:hypothetical protein
MTLARKNSLRRIIGSNSSTPANPGRRSLALASMAFEIPGMTLAHAGHWAMYVVYAVPVAVVLASVVITVRRERREARDGGDAQGAEPTGSPKPSVSE